MGLLDGAKKGEMLASKVVAAYKKIKPFGMHPDITKTLTKWEKQTARYNEKYGPSATRRLEQFDPQAAKELSAYEGTKGVGYNMEGDDLAWSLKHLEDQKVPRFFRGALQSNITQHNLLASYDPKTQAEIADYIKSYLGVDPGTHRAMNTIFAKTFEYKNELEPLLKDMTDSELHTIKMIMPEWEGPLADLASFVKLI